MTERSISDAEQVPRRKADASVRHGAFKMAGSGVQGWGPIKRIVVLALRCGLGKLWLM